MGTEKKFVSLQRTNCRVSQETSYGAKVIKDRQLETKKTTATVSCILSAKQAGSPPLLPPPPLRQLPPPCLSCLYQRHRRPSPASPPLPSPTSYLQLHRCTAGP